jgi:hypothetical protein
MWAAVISAHSYYTAAWRFYNNDANACRLDFVVGVAEDPVELNLRGEALAYTLGQFVYLGLAYDGVASNIIASGLVGVTGYITITLTTG